jgi:hypothetical protein
MKRLITSLSVLLLCTSAYADAFGPNDKVLYFNSETLIEVIKNTFPQNLQLDVANKYVELMDSKGNVSIDDLRTVCGVGQLDNAKCKNFIRDLIDTMGDGMIKPFYWADYVSKSPEPIKLAVYSSGDGYHKNAGLDSGEWAMTFGWMKENNFMRQYPQTKYIRGISACTNESGSKNVADASKNFALNEQSGEQCWCKMTGPEESAWVYNKYDGMAGGCARSCALECVSALRTEPMRAAMFTAVKLNGSNANTSDEKVIGDALKDEFKPCEFDWKNIGRFKTKPWIDYDENGWRAGGFDWMNSEEFKCKYPGVKQIRGIAATQDVEGAHVQNNNGEWSTRIGLTRSNIIHQDFGSDDCWCKMIYPEQSKWVLCNVVMSASRSDCNMACADAFQGSTSHSRHGWSESDSEPLYECIKSMFQSINN